MIPLFHFPWHLNLSNSVCERVVESCNGQVVLEPNLSALDLSSIEYVASTSSEHITELIISNKILYKCYKSYIKSILLSANY